MKCMPYSSKRCQSALQTKEKKNNKNIDYYWVPLSYIYHFAYVLLFSRFNINMLVYISMLTTNVTSYDFIVSENEYQTNSKPLHFNVRFGVSLPQTDMLK